jgi:SAM-dependent methyltransferase
MLKAWQLPRRPGETDAELTARRDRQYFLDQIEENIEWWRRMGISIDLVGKRVLEVGCGHGALSINAAQRGAAVVVGIDIDQQRVNFANTNIAANPVPGGNVSFRTGELADIDSGSFDLVMSKDCFEHVVDLPRMMSEIHRVLADGGLLVAGFSPLYYSPWGDHGRTRLGGLPWLHVALPEAAIKLWLRYRHGQIIDSIADLGLNKMTTTEFGRIIHDGGWRIRSIRINQKDGSKLIRLFDALRKIPPLERFFAVSIYAVLEKAS